MYLSMKDENFLPLSPLVTTNGLNEVDSEYALTKL